MNQPRRIVRCALAALLALSMLAFAAGCDLTDPVVSVGSPLPEASSSDAPADTAATTTPTAAPTSTPIASASPSASPAAEANGTGAYTITADINESQKTYYSESSDENALRVENSALASIDGASIEKRTGDASNLDNTLAYGLNAAVLVRSGAQLLLVNSDVTSEPTGAGGAFSSGGVLQLQSGSVRTTGDYSFGLAVNAGGSVSAREFNVYTQGGNSPAVYAASGGSVTIDGGMLATGDSSSPVVKAAGSVSAASATLRANSAGAAVVLGGTVTLTDCAVSGGSDSTADGSGTACVSLYAGAAGSNSAFSMTRGALTAVRSDLFYAADASASIYLEGVALSLNEGRALLRAVSESGEGGADCALTAKDQSLYGNIIVDERSSVRLTLQGDSDYTGTVNASNTALSASVTLEDESTWTLTDNAYLTSFSGRVGSIVTNGFTVYVNGVALTE